MSRKGVENRRFVTVTEIAHELRVRPDTLRSSGILDGCRRIPAGKLGRYELWLWADVERAVLAYAHGEQATSPRNDKRVRPASQFVSLGGAK